VCGALAGTALGGAEAADVDSDALRPDAWAEDAPKLPGNGKGVTLAVLDVLPAAAVALATGACAANPGDALPAGNAADGNPAGGNAAAGVDAGDPADPLALGGPACGWAAPGELWAPGWRAESAAVGNPDADGEPAPDGDPAGAPAPAPDPAPAATEPAGARAPEPGLPITCVAA
jgi:hypothetical protein